MPDKRTQEEHKQAIATLPHDYLYHLARNESAPLNLRAAATELILEAGSSYGEREDIADIVRHVKGEINLTPKPRKVPQAIPQHPPSPMYAGFTTANLGMAQPDSTAVTIGVPDLMKKESVLTPSENDKPIVKPDNTKPIDTKTAS